MHKYHTSWFDCRLNEERSREIRAFIEKDLARNAGVYRALAPREADWVDFSRWYDLYK